IRTIEEFMSNFCFYLGGHQEIADRMRLQAASIWGDVKEIVRDSFRLFIPSADYTRSFSESRAAVGAISGYVISVRIKGEGRERDGLIACHNRQFINEIIDDDRWRLGDDWTGSFGAIAYAKASRQVIVCNDPIG